MVEGTTLLGEALRGGARVQAVFAGPGAELPPGLTVPVHRLAPGVVERVASTTSPQPVLAVVERVDVPFADLVAHRPTFVVVAAGLADPGNLGTVLRSAEASGADAVVLTEGTVDVTNPKCVRASAGALFHVPVAVDVPLGRLRELGLRLLGSHASEGVPYDEADLVAPLALVLGNEAHGLPAGLELDGTVTVPHLGRAESLNVAMAASVLCFEVARQRRKPSPSQGASSTVPPR